MAGALFDVGTVPDANARYLVPPIFKPWATALVAFANVTLTGVFANRGLPVSLFRSFGEYRVTPEIFTVTEVVGLVLGPKVPMSGVQCFLQNRADKGLWPLIACTNT